MSDLEKFVLHGNTKMVRAILKNHGKKLVGLNIDQILNVIKRKLTSDYGMEPLTEEQQNTADFDLLCSLYALSRVH